MICWKCQKEIPVQKPLRGDECPLCHADLHVCKACEFYESGAHNDCRESSAEFVSDKERGNFCDYFRPGKCFLTGSEVTDTGKSKADAARDAFNALFN
ncbi:MAG: hypothetical protein J6X84_02105 [Treponema sp.]|nr:hypothetical protein [Treponema sp.]